MAMQAVGEYLRRLRKARGLKQAEVAALVNASVKQIGRWEYGQSNPSFITLSYVAQKLGGTSEDVQTLLAETATLELARELATRRPEDPEWLTVMEGTDRKKVLVQEGTTASDEDILVTPRESSAEDSGKLQRRVQDLEQQVQELKHHMFESLKFDFLGRPYKGYAINDSNRELIRAFVAMLAQQDQRLASLASNPESQDDIITAIQDTVEREAYRQSLLQTKEAATNAPLPTGQGAASSVQKRSTKKTR